MKAWLWASVFCPKCMTRNRAKMSLLRLFGTQTCQHCKHVWIPPRQGRDGHSLPYAKEEAAK